MKKLFVKNQEASPKGYTPPTAVDDGAQSTFDRQTAEALWLSGSGTSHGAAIPQTPPTSSLFAGMAVNKEPGSSFNGTPAAAVSTPSMDVHGSGEGGGGGSAFSFIQQAEAREDGHDDSIVSNFSFIQDSNVPSSPPPAYGTGSPIDAVSAFSFLQTEKAEVDAQPTSISDQLPQADKRIPQKSPSPQNEDVRSYSPSLSAKQTIEPRGTNVSYVPCCMKLCLTCLEYYRMHHQHQYQHQHQHQLQVHLQQQQQQQRRRKARGSRRRRLQQGDQGMRPGSMTRQALRLR